MHWELFALGSPVACISLRPIAACLPALSSLPSLLLRCCRPVIMP